MQFENEEQVAKKKIEKILHLLNTHSSLPKEVKNDTKKRALALFDTIDQLGKIDEEAKMEAAYKKTYQAIERVYETYGRFPIKTKKRKIRVSDVIDPYTDYFISRTMDEKYKVLGQLKDSQTGKRLHEIVRFAAYTHGLNFPELFGNKNSKEFIDTAKKRYPHCSIKRECFNPETLFNKTDYFSYFNDFTERKVENIRLFKTTYEKGTLELAGGLSIYDDATAEAKIAETTENIDTLLLSIDDEVWMSLTPSEFNTMEKDIDQARGNVLVCGLGLGYFAYEINKKEDVTNITIIEKDPKIIQLFKEEIEPRLPFTTPLTIIQDDAYMYLENHALDTFDYIYVDIHQSVFDTVEVIRKLIHLGIKERCHVWLEEEVVENIKFLFLQDLYDLAPTQPTTYEKEIARMYENLQKEHYKHVFVNYNEKKFFQFFNNNQHIYELLFD